MRHVVWDWNGTLLADQQATLAALHAVMDDAGRPPTTLDVYQRLYTRPVRIFYERLFERPVSDDEWLHIDAVYHREYGAALDAVDLAPDARPALARVTETGRTQSLLSMLAHDALELLVDRFDIGEHFVRVDGLRGPAGGRKIACLEAHLEQMAAQCGHDPSQILLVGDALDDLHAAQHVGARCVLYDGGSHPRDELAAAGVPVADTLLDAVTAAGIT